MKQENLAAECVGKDQKIVESFSNVRNANEKFQFHSGSKTTHNNNHRNSVDIKRQYFIFCDIC